MLIKVDDGLYINPEHVVFVGKMKKEGHALDHDPDQPNPNVVKMITGDVFEIKQEIEELCDKIGVECD